MKRYEFFALGAAIWMAPHNPQWLSVALSAFWLLMAYLSWKRDE